LKNIEKTTNLGKFWRKTKSLRAF